MQNVTLENESDEFVILISDDSDDQEIQKNEEIEQKNKKLIKSQPTVSPVKSIPEPKVITDNKQKEKRKKIHKEEGVIKKQKKEEVIKEKPKKEEGIKEKPKKEEDLKEANDRYSIDITEYDKSQFGDTNFWLKGGTRTIGNRVYGNIGTYPSNYANRTALSESKIHTPIQQGINGYGNTPAASVVTSPAKTGYDERGDSGRVLIYSGQGTKGDQELTRFNESLYHNCKEKIPVRLIRGAGLNGKYAPNFGYRYDGLYWVTKVFTDFQNKERTVYQFRLVQLDLSSTIPISEKVPKNKLIQSSKPIIRRPKLRTDTSDVKIKKTGVILDDDDDDEEEVEMDGGTVMVPLEAEEVEIKSINEMKEKFELKKLKEKELKEKLRLEIEEEIKMKLLKERQDVWLLFEKEIEELKMLELENHEFEEAVVAKEKIKELKKKKETLKRYRLFNAIFYQHLNDLLEISLKYKIISLFKETIEELYLEFNQKSELNRIYFFLHVLFSNDSFLLNTYQKDILTDEKYMKIFQFVSLNNFVGLSKYSSNFDKDEMVVYILYLKKLKKEQEIIMECSIKED